MTSCRVPVALGLLLAVSLVATLAIHLLYVPRLVSNGPLLAAPYALAGWVTFAFVFYAVGRLATTPDAMPNMRTADLGVALVLISLLVAAALDTYGFGIEAVPVAYVLPTIGLYAGLALFGWSLGRRTAAINRIASER